MKKIGDFLTFNMSFLNGIKRTKDKEKEEFYKIRKKSENFLEIPGYSG